MYDIVIVGAGVSGCAAARELSRYQAKICVLERESDVCEGTSKANSAIVHAGYDAANGSLMAKLNVMGNRMMEALSAELDFPFRRNGSLVLCMHREDMPGLQVLYERGQKNGVEGLEILDAPKLRALEPGVSDEAVAALYAPTGGIVCPFGLNIALAENAFENGVEFRFQTEVKNIRRQGDFYQVETSGGLVSTRYLVNAAGVYGDRLHNMVSEKKLKITPRRGDYCLLDRMAGETVAKTIFTLPGKLGKGILVTPTVHGNILLGPTAIDIEDREGTNTTREGLDIVLEKARSSVKNIPTRQIITSFAGIRAHEEGHEFIIGEVEDSPGFIDCAGIESPGLSSSPAIGKMVADLLREKAGLLEKENFNPRRRGVLNPQTLSVEERNSLIRENPAYGNVICRCENVTEGEILDAIHRPLGARTLDGVKRRTRAGMGRCQAGFCSPRVMDILSRELGLSMLEITKSGSGSSVVAGTNKDAL